MAHNQKDPPASDGAPGGGRDLPAEQWQDDAWLPGRRQSTEGSMSKRDALLQTLRADIAQNVPAEVALDRILAELREPDEGMLRGCVDAMPEHANWLNQRATFFVWQAMIDAITTEPPK